MGFQLRVGPEQLPLWTPERRRKYLLRDDVRRPLSVDTEVWPISEDRKLHAELFSDFTNGAPPNGLGVYSPRSADWPRELGRSMLIALTATSDEVSWLRKQHLIGEMPFTSAALRDQGFQCLGFDCADGWLNSGLANCGYDPEDKARLGALFNSRLNESGLFALAESAAEFCAECDRRVPGHAPFLIYGLYAYRER